MKTRDRMVIFWKMNFEVVSFIKNLKPYTSGSLKTLVFYTLLSKPLNTCQFIIFCCHNTEMFTSTCYDRCRKILPKTCVFTYFSMLFPKWQKCDIYYLIVLLLNHFKTLIEIRPNFSFLNENNSKIFNFIGFCIFLPKPQICQ